MRTSRKITIGLVALATVGATVGIAVAAFNPGAVEVAASEPPSPEPEVFPTIPPPPSPDPRVLPTLAPPAPVPGGPSYDVAAVQRQLNVLHYYIGPPDGEAGPAFRSAVMAFQKVQGLTADGVVGESTLAALAAPVTPELRGGPPNRVEVDLDRQVLYLVEGGQLMRILPVSSGSGQTYRTQSGGLARSLTPTGWFTIERRIKGVRNAALGVLYDPMYFYRGWAIHGSNSVPAHPASHGCVRVTRPDAVWLFERVPNGTPVHLYGGTYTFTGGSSAPGTDDPAGDTDSGTAPAPQPDTASSPSPTEPPAATPTQPPADGASDTPSENPPDPGSGSADGPGDEPTPGETPTEPEPSESPSGEPPEDGQAGPALPTP